MVNEEARLAALRHLHLLDTPPTKAFDRITQLASRLLYVPISSISLLDRNRQYFKSRVGFDLIEAPRELAPCNWTICGDGVHTVPDMCEDARFEETPMVRRGVRFYAGAPLVTRAGHSLGTLCVMDTQPRTFAPHEVELLVELAEIVMSQIELQNSIGRIHPVSGRPNEYQLIDDLDDLSRQMPEIRHTALLVEIVDGRQLRHGVRVFGNLFVETLIHSSTATVQGALGQATRLYHIGGTRCVILLDQAAADTSQLARRLLCAMREPIVCTGIPVRAEPAVGIHAFRPGTTTSRDVLRRLYSALDDARVEPTLMATYDERHDPIHARRYRLLAGVAAALQSGSGLSLVFQPRVDLDGRPCGVEALLRWRDLVHGDISPAEFMPLAEETALISLLTQWVLEHALAQIAAWRHAGQDVKVSINLA